MIRLLFPRAINTKKFESKKMSELVWVNCFFYGFYLPYEQLQRFGIHNRTVMHILKRDHEDEQTSPSKRRYIQEDVPVDVEHGLTQSKFRRSFRHHSFLKSHISRGESKSLPNISTYEEIDDIRHIPTFQSFFSYMWEMKRVVFDYIQGRD